MASPKQSTEMLPQTLGLPQDEDGTGEGTLLIELNKRQGGLPACISLLLGRGAEALLAGSRTSVCHLLGPVPRSHPERWPGPRREDPGNGDSGRRTLRATPLPRSLSPSADRRHSNSGTTSTCHGVSTAPPPAPPGRQSSTGHLCREGQGPFIELQSPWGGPGRASRQGRPATRAAGSLRGQSQEQSGDRSEHWSGSQEAGGP